MSVRSLFQLDPRLQLCAGLVKKGAFVADVGTDHAYLPVWLARMGLVSHAIACDLRQGPLEQAAHNIEKYRVEQWVETRLSDGLDKIRPDEVDTVVIAGMGGEVMIQILKKASWLKEEKNLILQPMTSVDKLRLWLLQQGYQVEKEKAVRAHGKIYTGMLVRYTGVRDCGDPLFPYIGLVGKESSPEAKEYIDREIGRQRKKEQGLRIQGRIQEADRLNGIILKMQLLMEDKSREDE